MSGGQNLYCLYNGHADVTGLVNEQGELVEKYGYDEWGVENGSVVYGDLNKDGYVNSTDYIFLRRYFLGNMGGLSDESRIAADLNGDGSVNSMDMALLKRMLLKSVEYCPADTNRDGYANEKSSIKYRGYFYDGETGLYYLNSRFYDPETARFIQEDTYRGNAEDPLSLNLYTYVLNNPIKYYDPFGYWDVPVGTANRSQGNTVEWKAGSTTGNSTITITTAMGATQTIREGTDFYIGTDNLAYYVNRPENAVKTTNSGSDVKWTAGAETGRSTITVTPKGMFGRLQTDKSTTLT